MTERLKLWTLRNKDTGECVDLVDAGVVAAILERAAKGRLLPGELRRYAEELRDLPTLKKDGEVLERG